MRASFGDYVKQDNCKPRIQTWDLPALLVHLRHSSELCRELHNLTLRHDVSQRTILNVLRDENLHPYHYQSVQCFTPVNLYLTGATERSLLNTVIWDQFLTLLEGFLL